MILLINISKVHHAPVQTQSSFTQFCPAIYFYQSLHGLKADAAIIKASVLNKDIGFVHEGQAVSIKVDAFPYTRYGTIDGELVSVSRDATADEQLGLVFAARVKLSRDEMLIDQQPVKLTPGMSVVAEIKTDRRRVIDYLLSPIREYQAEALRER